MALNCAIPLKSTAIKPANGNLVQTITLSGFGDPPYEPRKLRENRALPIMFTPISCKLIPAILQDFAPRFNVIFICPKVQSLGLKMGGYPALKTLLLAATLTIYSLFDRSSYRGASVLALSILILLFLNVLIKISKTRSTLSLMFFAIPNWFIVNFQVSPLSLKFLVIF